MTTGVPGFAYGVSGSLKSLQVPAPRELMARTLIEYAVPFVRPVSVHELAVVVQLGGMLTPPAGFTCTSYPVMVLPFEAGAVH